MQPRLPTMLSPLDTSVSRDSSHLRQALLLFALFTVWIVAFWAPVRVNLMAPLLLAASAGFLMWGRSGSLDIFHPVRLFGSLWCFCLALASLRLSEIISDWDFRMWAAVLTALVSFIVGFWAFRAGSSKARRQVDLPTVLPPSEALAPSATLIVAAFCLFLSLAGLTYEFLLIGGVPILADNPDAARMQLFGILADPRYDTVTVKLVHLLVGCYKYAFSLACIVLFQNRKKGKTVLVGCVLILFPGLLAAASQGGRSLVCELLIIGIFLFHYLKRRMRLREVAAAGVALIVFLSAGGALRAMISRPFTARREVLWWSVFPEGAFWDYLAYGYFALTASFEVFYRLMCDLPGVPTSSGFLFWAFHRLVPRENIQALASRLYTGVMITPTFLGEFYADLGFFGIFIGPLILGWVYGWVYDRATRFTSLYAIIVLVFLLHHLTFFPYVNLFVHYFTWIVDLIVMALLIRVAKGSRPRATAFSITGGSQRFGRAATGQPRGGDDPGASAR